MVLTDRVNESESDTKQQNEKILPFPSHLGKKYRKMEVFAPYQPRLYSER